MEIIRAVLTTTIQYTDLCEEVHTVKAGTIVLIEKGDDTVLIDGDRIEIKKDQYAVVN